MHAAKNLIQVDRLKTYARMHGSLAESLWRLDFRVILIPDLQLLHQQVMKFDERVLILRAEVNCQDHHVNASK